MLYRPGLRDEAPPRGGRRPGEARRASASCASCIDAIAALDGQAGERRRERRLRPGPPAHRPQRQRAGRPPAASWKSWPLAAKQPVIRQIGYRLADQRRRQRRQGLGAGGQRRQVARRTFVSAMPLIPDPGVRASPVRRVEPLLDGLPAPLARRQHGQGHARPVTSASSCPARGR